MGAMASQITSLTVVCLTVYQRKHQSSASLSFVRGIHRWPGNSPHKWPVTQKIFPFDDVSMFKLMLTKKNRSFLIHKQACNRTNLMIRDDPKQTYKCYNPLNFESSHSMQKISWRTTNCPFICYLLFKCLIFPTEI